MWICPQCGREFLRNEQQHYCGRPKTIDEYILQQDEPHREKLQEIRLLIREAIPDAQERISWSMPTFWKGKNLIHFAASKKHLGVYPGDEATAFFAQELKDFNTSKGTIRLPWSAPLPSELIRKIARWCYTQYHT